jgi:hypothetical protein
MKRQLGILAATLLVLSLLGTSGASAATSKTSFGWHAGDSFGGVLESPDEAMADNGDVVVIAAGGTMDVGAKTATGGGTFTHMSGSTVVGTGTLTATRLMSFQFYGCGGDGFPNNFCGGRALIAVHIVGHPTTGGTVELDGTLTVDCLIGTPPGGANEGVTLNVKDLINFNREVEGETLFVATS